jgi:hypothetical protein
MIKTMLKTSWNPLTRVGLGLVAAGVLAAFAVSVAPHGAPPAAAADSNFSITGTVQGVAYDQNVIEVSGPAGKQSIHITPTTSIAKHGEVGSISDLRPGVHVVVSGVISAGQHVAVTIEIK